MSDAEKPAAPLTTETAANAILDRFFTPRKPEGTETATAETPPKPAAEAAPKPEEETPAAEAEPSETDETPSDEEAPADDEETPLYTVTIDGKEEQVTLEEALKGYSRNKHFTQSMQKLAEERKADTEARAAREKAHEEVTREVSTKRDELIANLTTVGEALKSLMPPEPNWEELRKTYSKEDVDAAYVQFTEQRSRIQRVFEARDQAAAEQKKALEAEADKYQAEQRGKLLEIVPEWKDPEKLSAGLRELTAEARKIGFSDAELASVHDHRLLLVLKDAVAYRKLKAAKPPIANTAKEVVVPAKPGSATPRKPVTDLTRSKQRLAKTGKLADAQEAIRLKLGG